MSMRQSAYAAPGQAFSPGAVRTRQVQGIGDSAPTDYAAEVERMIASARSPVAIASGIAGGMGAAYGIVKLRRRKPRTALGRYIVPGLGGLFAGSITHAGASWLLYRHAPNPIADTPAPGGATERETVAMTRALYHPLAVGAGIGTTAAAGYGLWKWRNPPGQKKTRWGIPLFGALIAGGMAQSLTGSIIRSTDNSQLSGITDFSSVGSTALTAVTIVCLYGGGKYLVDSWTRKKNMPTHFRRSLRDRPGNNGHRTRPSSSLPVVTP